MPDVRSEDIVLQECLQIQIWFGSCGFWWPDKYIFKYTQILIALLSKIGNSLLAAYWRALLELIEVHTQEEKGWLMSVIKLIKEAVESSYLIRIAASTRRLHQQNKYLPWLVKLHTTSRAPGFPWRGQDVPLVQLCSSSAGYLQLCCEAEQYPLFPSDPIFKKHWHKWSVQPIQCKP